MKLNHTSLQVVIDDNLINLVVVYSCVLKLCVVITGIDQVLHWQRSSAAACSLQPAGTITAAYACQPIADSDLDSGGQQGINHSNCFGLPTG